MDREAASWNGPSAAAAASSAKVIGLGPEGLGLIQGLEFTLRTK